MNFERFSALRTPWLSLVVWIFLGSIHLDPAFAAEEQSPPQPEAGSSVLTTAPVAAPATPPTDSEWKKMSERFKATLLQEKAALGHRQKKEAQVMKASHRSQEREWKAREKQARKEFFASNTDGKTRREWMKDRQRRHDELLTGFKQQRETQESEQKALRVKLEQDQKSRQGQFENAREQKVLPPVEIWTSGLL